MYLNTIRRTSVRGRLRGGERTVEPLEGRVLLSAASIGAFLGFGRSEWPALHRQGPAENDHAHHHGDDDDSHESRGHHKIHPVRITPPIQRSTITPDNTAAPTGYTPAQIRHAYGIDQITFQGGTIQGNGAGQTIAIVDAMDDPTIASDLHAFDAQFGLPDPTFNKYAPEGLPSPDSGWSIEISLDVQWAHVIAPAATIDLVEAVSSYDTDLLSAVDWTRNNIPGVSVISMSFGAPENASETQDDPTYTTPAGHQGITFVASTGDSGAPGGYPAMSPNVLAVGGTTLSADAQGNYLGETGWSGSGGGPSQFEPLPSWQTSVAGTHTTRLTPDVAFDADPNSGVPIYDSYADGASTPWAQYGGTSLAAPCWGGLIAVANQGRVADGLGTLDGPTQTLPMIYALPASVFHDITSGNNGYAAGPGYDFVTGRGSPIADQLVPLLTLKPNIVVNGTAGNDVIYLKRQGNFLSEWINSATPGQGTPTHQEVLVGATSLAIHGAGGSDSITLDESNGNIFLATNTLDDVNTSTGAHGSIALTLIGTANADTVTINGTSKAIAFNGNTLTFNDVASITYTDDGGADTITTYGPIPIILNLTGSDTVTTNDANVTINVNSSNAPATVRPANLTTTPTVTPTTSDGSSTPPLVPALVQPAVVTSLPGIKGKQAKR